MLAVSSGTICASGSSSFSTVSTMIVLNFPDGVSRIVPMGTRESFSVIAMRIFRRMIKADSWLFIVENVPNHTCPR